MIRKLVSWLFDNRKSCGICGGELDKNYGEIQYKPALEEETTSLKVCSICIEYLENEHQRFVNTMEEWKKHEEL